MRASRSDTTLRTGSSQLLLPMAMIAMAMVVVASNVLVRFPVHGQLGPLQLADLLTWAAFTYPVAFLVTDLANRSLGAARARLVVICGFAAAVGLSIWLATPRIAIASGMAFLTAQLLDVTIFEHLRRGDWWRAPLISSLVGSVVDTVLFFSLAFAVLFMFLGPNDAFAIEKAPLLGFLPVEAARWVSWALGDLTVKMLVAVVLLAPYRIMIAFTPLARHA